jgi:hypothetical protein
MTMCDREALWHHLRHVIGATPQVLTDIQNMSSGDAYRLVDGLTQVAPVMYDMGLPLLNVAHHTHTSKSHDLFCT